jgi:protein-S-isoprenylcysteine O-methyltransferase Ste14
MQQKRKIVPPVYLLASIGLMVYTAKIETLGRFLPETWAWIGVIFLVLGLVMIFSSFGLFTKADTGVVPFDEARALVTGGFYRFTRNPMYLGMVLILLGAASKAGTVGALIPIPLFVAVIHFNFILGEEEFLEEAFGDDYLAFKSRVRRWV